MMPNEDMLKVVALFPEISEWVKVLDVTYQDGLTTKVEGIKKALEAVKKEDSGHSCKAQLKFRLSSVICRQQRL
jgi:hypothetical protein